MESYIGVILKRYTTKNNKISMLDKQLGRIEGILASDIMSVGSLLQYSAQPCTGGFFLTNIQIVHVPLLLAKIDLLFLHHVFELCYYFAPIGSSVLGVFDLLMFLYAAEQESGLMIRLAFLLQAKHILTNFLIGYKHLIKKRKLISFHLSIGSQHILLLILLIISIVSLIIAILCN